MSAEPAATIAAPANAADQNAQAAEDAKRMLAELQGGVEAGSVTKTEEHSSTNGKSEAAEPTPGKSSDTLLDGKEDEVKNDKKNENEGVSEKNARGNQRPGHGRDGYNNRSRRENIKSDLTTQKESRDPVEIRKQIEFYFSDSNLPMDKFLLSKVGGSKNNPVELSVIHSFKRMRRFQPFEAIVEALRESTFLELTDNDTCVRRKVPLPASLDSGPTPEAIQVFEDRSMPRSIYAKGFGEEEPSTQFDIEAFFARYGPTNAIRLRRQESKIFKGSVFVEFATEELQQNFLSLDPKPKYKGKELSIMSKKVYCEGKVADIKAGRIKPNDRHVRKNYRDGRPCQEKRKRDNEDDRDWRERREEDRRNGFRDDRRGGRRRGSPDYYAGSKKNARAERKAERDHRGVPIVKTGGEDSSPEATKKDAATADALAKAKAAVEAEQKKEQDAKAKPTEAGGSMEIKEAAGSEETNGSAARKHEREEDDEELPVAKKADCKPGAVEVIEAQS